MCLFYFPQAMPLVRLCNVRGLHSMVEKIFLYVIARDIPVTGDILEIGSFAGSSALILARANQASGTPGALWLVEPQPQPDKETFLRMFKDRRLDARVRLVDRTSEEARSLINASFRFIFVDGNHEYEYVRRDIELWQDRLQPGGIIAFHDSRAPGVARAIQELIHGSGAYTVLGTVCSMCYASKGAYHRSAAVARLGSMNAMREKLIATARKLKLKS